MVVEVPQQLSDHQRALLEELAEAMDSEAQLPKRQGFLDKLKNLFE
jgi:DnaJ-class molecular chaperone